MKAETKLQIAIIKYIKLQYPEVLFSSDFSAGLRLPMWLAVLRKKMTGAKGLPDLIFYKKNKKYNGLAIEIKAAEIYKKNGNLKKNKHLQEQEKILQKLREENFFAVFAVGFENAKNIIDEYFKGGF